MGRIRDRTVNTSSGLLVAYSYSKAWIVDLVPGSSAVANKKVGNEARQVLKSSFSDMIRTSITDVAPGQQIRQWNHSSLQPRLAPRTRFR